MYPQSPFSALAPAEAESGQDPAASHHVHAGGRAARTVRLTRLGFTGVLVAALGLGAVACGGSSPGASGSASPPASAAAGSGSVRGTGLESRIYKYLNGVPAERKSAFVQCMRKNGEPSLPTTLTLSALQSAGITIRSTAFRSAFTSCKSTLVK